MKTPTEIAKVIDKDLKSICKQANVVQKKSEAVIENCRKEGHLQKRKRKFYLNPRRKNKLNPLEVSKKFRKEAREVFRKMDIEFRNLMLHRRMVRDEKEKVEDAYKAVIFHLKEMELAVTNLSSSSGDVEGRIKLFNYERRKEIELYERIFESSPTKETRKSKIKGTIKGDTEMSKKSSKQEIVNLLAKLGKATDQQEKREIRASLRKLGHKGGLGKGGGRPKSSKKATKKVTKKVTKKTKKSKKAKKTNKSAA